jgi:mRNA interferase RelE/StbE
VLYEVFILPRAEKELSKLPAKELARVKLALVQLGNQPRGPGCKKLAGREGWRKRVGNYRVVYEVSDASRTVTILHIGHRKDVYR